MNFDFGFDYNVPYSLPGGTTVPTFGTGTTGADFGGFAGPFPGVDTTYGGLETVTPPPTVAANQSQGNWLDRLGGFARDITPLLYGAGSIIEGIKGVPPGQSRFAGFNQGIQLDMLARSLGYNNGREMIETRRTGVKPPPKPGEEGGSVIKPTVPPNEDLTRFRGGEGAATDGKTLGLNAVLRGANEYGISPKEFVEMGVKRGYEFGPKALEARGGSLSAQGLSSANVEPLQVIPNW